MVENINSTLKSYSMGLKIMNNKKIFENPL